MRIRSCSALFATRSAHQQRGKGVVRAPVSDNRLCDLTAARAADALFAAVDQPLDEGTAGCGVGAVSEETAVNIGLFCLLIVGFLLYIESTRGG